MSDHSDWHPLAAAARQAWGKVARQRRWTLWVGLSYGYDVTDELTVVRHMNEWASWLVSHVPYSWVLSGIHRDSGRLHVHALIFLPNRLIRPSGGVKIVEWCWDQWLRLGWKHGMIDWRWFTPETATEHGAGVYLARFPDTVMLFGNEPMGGR